MFIGKNNPEVLWLEDAPGVSPDYMYCMDEWSRNELMVSDMAT